MLYRTFKKNLTTETGGVYFCSLNFYERGKTTIQVQNVARTIFVSIQVVAGMLGFQNKNI